MIRVGSVTKPGWGVIMLFGKKRIKKKKLSAEEEFFTEGRDSDEKAEASTESPFGKTVSPNASNMGEKECDSEDTGAALSRDKSFDRGATEESYTKEDWVGKRECNLPDSAEKQEIEPKPQGDGASSEGSVSEGDTPVAESGSGVADADMHGEDAEEENTLQNDSFQEKKYKEKKGFFARLKEGLAKTRNNIVRGIDSLFNGFSAIDDDFYEELEEILIMGDIGVNATTEIVARLKAQIKEQRIKEPRECKQLLIEGIKEQMRVDATAYDFEKRQSVIMVIGVNGVGKTTSVGKLAGKLKDQGRRVLIAAADTFRAAAGDQLAEWARRADVPMVGGNEGADPASVVFDAVNAAKARGVDVLLIDTAGRLHNKKNLMEELRKMNRIIDREFPDAHRENLIVLDGTTGQNALVQAREFGTVADLTGIILTKMDGTAKGGIAVAIQSELHVPVKYIGVGETIEDLQKFDSDEFVNALFDVKTDED